MGEGESQNINLAYVMPGTKLKTSRSGFIYSFLPEYCSALAQGGVGLDLGRAILSQGHYWFLAWFLHSKLPLNLPGGGVVFPKKETRAAAPSSGQCGVRSLKPLN